MNLELGVGADFGEFASRTEIEDDAFFCWEGADDADPRGGKEAAEDAEALLPLCEVVPVVVVFAVVTDVELGVGAVVDCEEMAHRCWDVICFSFVLCSGVGSFTPFRFGSGLFVAVCFSSDLAQVLFYFFA